MFQRVYVATGLTILLSALFWLGFNYLVTGFGPVWCAGFCTGGIFMLALMFFGGLWAEGARKRDERRRLQDTPLSPLRRIE